MPMPPDKREGPPIGEPGASRIKPSLESIGRYYDTARANAVQASNIIPFPSTISQPAMPDKCQALYRDAVAKRNAADTAMRRFQSAFQGLSNVQDGTK